VKSETGSKSLTDEQRSGYLDNLNAENLSALMRSTWTWDDRALRRRLSELLVDLTAARELQRGNIECSPHIVTATQCRVLAGVGEFVAEVLGPRLLVTTDNPFRDGLLPLVEATASLTAEADAAVEELAVDVTGCVIERNEDLATILPEEQWATTAFDGPVGLAQVAYSSGFTLGDTEYFASAGLGAQAFSIAASPTDSSVDVRSCTLAAAERTGSWDPALVKVRAEADGDGWSITGDKWYVPGANDADALLVVARTVGGPSLYAVDKAAPGVGVEILPSLDPTRPLARISFTAAPARRIGREGAGGRIMNRTVDRATTALAGEQTGMVDSALKHLAELPPPSEEGDNSWYRFTRGIAELELRRSAATALWYRAVKYQNSDNLDAASAAAAMAHIGCSSAVREVALQIDTVFTGADEAFVDKLRARARSTDLLLGGPALAHERLLERLGI
jgi:alkylation response protein AidB-like acyl-CoA dehydrogenase